MQLLFQNWSISFLLDFNFTCTTVQNTKFTYLLWYLYDTNVVDYLITNSTFTLKIDKLQVNACRNDIDGVMWESLRIAGCHICNKIPTL